MVNPRLRRRFSYRTSRDANSGGDAYFFGIDHGVTADGKS
jgi:hypothetical protein